MEELLFKTIESGYQPLPRVKKLQDEIEVLKLDIELAEYGIEPELTEMAEINYLCDLKSAMSSYLTELYTIKNKEAV